MSKNILPFQAGVLTIMTYEDGTYDVNISTKGDVNVPQLIEVLQEEIKILELEMRRDNNPVWPKLEIAFSGKIKV